MTEAAILSISLFTAEQLLKQSPKLFLQFQQLLAEKNITVEQLRAKREAIAKQTFEELVPNSELPPELDAPQSPV